MLSPRAFITIHSFLKLAGELYLFPRPCGFPQEHGRQSTTLAHNLDVAHLSDRTYIDRIQDSEAGSEGT